MNKSWLPILIPLEELIQWEIFIIILILTLASWGFQKFFFKTISEERNKNLQLRFKNLYRQIITLSILTATFFILETLKDISLVHRILPYIGLSTVIAGCVSFIQICRIMLLQYLFLTSERTAVPILLVNIFTLLLSVLVTGWIITSIFGIKVAPLLATSAAFSIILGLALQDTLGNLFAGIALQIDHSFEIGDWIEVNQSGQKILGQVLEITWRSTVLVGLLDELISIPNRSMAQSQINNWTRNDIPIARSQSFRISYQADIELVLEVLNQALLKVTGVRTNPKPVSLVSESSESWILVKVIYYIDDYGKFATIADRVIRQCLHDLKQDQIMVAYPKVEVLNNNFSR